MSRLLVDNLDAQHGALEKAHGILAGLLRQVAESLAGMADELLAMV